MTSSDSAQQAKLAEWLPWREDYLDELLCSDRLDGRPLVCVACQCPGNTRCVDCCGQDIFCDTCLLVSHSRLPLHRVEVRFFIAITSYIPYQPFTPSDGTASTLVLTFSEHLASLCSWVVTRLARYARIPLGVINSPFSTSPVSTRLSSGTVSVPLGISPTVADSSSRCDGSPPL